MTSKELIKEGLPIVTEYNDKYEHTSLAEVMRYANENDVSAIYELAYRYRCGDGGAEKDEIKAVELYKKVLGFQNNTGALYRIGFAYSDGVMGKNLEKECIPYYEAAIELKDPDSAIQLGIIYEYGEELVEKDSEKALYYYNLAIQYGRTDGYYYVGNIYKKRNQFEKAMDYYEQAVDNKEFNSALELGIMYEDGIGCEKNYENAAYYYALAYDNNIKNSGYFLGRLFFFGSGVEVDDIRAFNLFKEESDNGSNMANLYLGQYYGMGIENFLEPDPGIAFLYLNNCTEYQKREVLYARGIIYLNTIKDYEKAKENLKEAAGMGHEKAKKILNSLEGAYEDLEESEYMYKEYSINQLKDIGVEHWGEACEQGNRFAPILIGMGYENGTEGFPIDLAKAEYYYNMGMERGEGFGACKLADLYRNKDKRKAVELYRKSADMGWLGALVNGAMVLNDLKEYDISRNWLNEYFGKVENPSADNMYVFACTFMARSYMHDTVSDDDISEMVKYLKLGEEYGGNSLIYAHLADFYAKGIGVEKNLDKAIFYYNKKGDFYHIGKIYIEAYNDAHKAMEYFEKAYREQKDKDGLSAAYELLSMCSFPEFENVIQQDYGKAEYYAREILDKEILPSVNYYVLGILSQLYNNQDVDNYIIKERNTYLLKNYKCFVYVEQNNIDEACNFLKEYLETICFNFFALEQYEDVNNAFNEIYQFISTEIPELLPGYRAGQGTKEFAFGLLYLDNSMLSEAKRSFEKAKECGRKDANDYLKRFSTSLFGKITFK